MKVTVNQQTPVSVSVGGSQKVLNATVDATGPQGQQGVQGVQGPAGANGLSLLSAATDVDVTNITDGALLIFSEASQKWEAGTMLESQYIEGGHF